VKAVTGVSHGIWAFACVEARGAGCISVPDGARSIVPYDCSKGTCVMLFPEGGAA